MTMNITSVSVQTNAQTGAAVSGKAASAANGGLFAEVFSQESDSQSSPSSASTANQGARAANGQHSSVPNKSVDTEPAEQQDEAPDDTSAELAAPVTNAPVTNAPVTNATVTHTTVKAASTYDASRQSADETSADQAELAPPSAPALSFAPNQTSYLESSELESSQTREAKADNNLAAEDAATEMNTQRQGGSALPPLESAASPAQAAVSSSESTAKSLIVDGQGQNKAEIEAESKIENKTESKAVTLNSDNPAANEAVKAAANHLNRTNIGSTGSVNPADLTAAKAGASAELSEGAAKQTSSAAASTTAQSVLASSAPLNAQATQVAQANNQTAQILAEHADVKMQAQAKVSEQAVNTEQANRTVNLAPEMAARTAAPEWLAQIEHGKRWSQAPSKATAHTLATDEASSALGEKLGDKSGAARAINAALTQAEQAGGQARVSVNSLAENAASDLSQTNIEQAKPLESTGQEASGLLLNREHTLLAASPERTAMLDKALTLHGSAEQNAKQLAQQAQVLVSQNLQEAEIKLNPSEFGAMRIQVRMEQGEVQVQFVASHPQARELLEQAMPRLREMLQQQGMNLQQGGQQQGNQQGQPSQNQAAAGFLSGQGLGQDSGQSGQQSGQQANQAASQTGQESEWRSYSANGDEIQEQRLNNQSRALYGADGAKIDFFA
ncbi:MAG: flagellar hook-length control protein FliK [Candidatus Oceanisphaera merdipullorum]|nr:flagellar hook-length control protein FliK [Candidatus Oceanisphaera merdipullorum]